MTDLAIPEGGGELAVPSPAIIGLEDYDPATDSGTSRTRIRIGKDDDGLPAWVSPNNDMWMDDGAYRGDLEVILLGFTKGRILFHHDSENGPSVPLCQSYDHTLGFPNVEHFEFDEWYPGQDGSTAMSCKGCKAEVWGSHPTRSTSYCAEQYYYPALQIDEEGNENPVIFTLQRSGLKACKKLNTQHKRKGIPLFTNVHTMSLKKERNGSVVYATPVFTKTDEVVDPDRAAELSAMFLDARTFLRTPYVPNDDTSETNVSVRPANATAEVVAESFGGTVEDDDEIGF